MMTLPPTPPTAGLLGPSVCCSMCTGADGFDFGVPNPMTATRMAAKPAIMAAITVGVFHQRSAGGRSPEGCLADVTRVRLAMAQGPPLPTDHGDTVVDGAWRLPVVV